MSIPLGPMQLAFYTRRSVRLRPPSKENERELFSSLDELGAMLASTSYDWFVVGGLGIDLHTGKLNRFHHDIDIEVPSEQKEDFLSHMSSHNYSLFKKVMSANVPSQKRMVVYANVSSDKCVPDNKRFRLVKTNEAGIVDGTINPLSYIDIFFTKMGVEGVQVGSHGKTFSLPVHPYTEEGMVYERNGWTFQLRNPVYEAQIKRDFSRPIDEFDKKTLASLLK